jgi:hypothetical protein
MVFSQSLGLWRAAGREVWDRNEKNCRADEWKWKR